MKRFRNISLVCPCDQAALERVVTLAKDHRARLTLVYPVKEIPARWSHMTAGQKRIDVRKLVYQEHRERLKKTAEGARALGVRPAARLPIGEPFLEIIRDVIQHGRDLVVTTAEGNGGLKARLFGSTSSHLMRKCPAPLLVLKPGNKKRFHRILAAIDPQITGSARDTLNGAILDLASLLAVRDDAELHIVHAWLLIGESLLRGRGGMYEADVNRIVRDYADQWRRSVEALVARHRVENHRLHVIKGNPADVIPLLVDRLGIDLLVMGTVCRTGVAGFIIGNTAERVLDAVRCSVLTIKPEGFVSPVAPLVSANK